MIDVKDELTLSDDKEYIVISKIIYEGNTYLYLTEKNNVKNIIFGNLQNDEIVEIEDKGLIKKLLPLFIKESKTLIEELKKSAE